MTDRPALQPVSLIYATANGGALHCAACLHRIMRGRHFLPRLFNASDETLEVLTQASAALFIVGSRHGLVPTVEAERFLRCLSNPAAPRLRHLRYSVAALGQRHLESGHHPAVSIDVALARLGAQPVYPRLECDADFEVPFFVWASGALAALRDRP